MLLKKVNRNPCIDLACWIYKPVLDHYCTARSNDEYICRLGQSCSVSGIPQWSRPDAGEVVNEVEAFVGVLRVAAATVHEHEHLECVDDALGVATLDGVCEFTKDKSIVKEEAGILKDHIPMFERL